MVRHVLRRVLARSCPDTVPRTGDEAKRLNCFVTFALGTDGEAYLLLDSVDGELIKCRQLENRSFSKDTTEHLRNLASMKLRIVHYYGLHTIEFAGVWDFLWHRCTRLIYFKILLQRTWDASAQFLFNRRSLTSQRRVDILRLLVRDRLSGSTEGLTYFDVMSKLYSTRWFNHPAQEERSSEVEFLLESLRESGDASKPPQSIQYVATNKSLITLEQFDEQDRRHRETSRLQVWIVILTMILALAAVVQTGIVRVPTLLDFTK